MDTAGLKHLVEIKHDSSPADFQDAGNQMNTLHQIRIKNANRLIIGHLNVNSCRNKFDMPEELIKDKIDIFLISETKLDSSVLSGQILIKGDSRPFRLDQKQTGGSLLFYVREDIPCKMLKEYTPEKPIENPFIEINLRSRKCLLSCSYNPKAHLIADHLHCIDRGIDFYSSKYDNFAVLGDLNTEVSNSFMGQFCA